jgi:hypothetical protein
MTTQKQWKRLYRMDPDERFDREHELRVELERRLARRKAEITQLLKSRAYEAETEKKLIQALEHIGQQAPFQGVRLRQMAGVANRALEEHRRRTGPRDGPPPQWAR